MNWAVYNLAWNPRRIGPWSPAEEEAPPRRWFDRLPLVGWWALRRESALHGRGYWIRPLLVELATGAGWAALYWWETVEYGLLPAYLPGPVTVEIVRQLHVQFAAHAALVLFMLAASLIDCDEKFIPDAVTVPGTLFGLAFAALYPWMLLPARAMKSPAGMDVFFLQITSPWPMPNHPGWLPGGSHPSLLLIALGCWWLWCVALMPRTWYSRHGWLRAAALAWMRMRRERASARLALLGLAGSLAIAACWQRGGPGWNGLFTALTAMIAGASLVWLVRTVGTAVLRREAMGFGDVVLTAMLGVYLGWQGCLLLFFLAPFAGLAIGLVVLLLRRDQEIPYGPFLCLAATAVLVRWAPLWQWSRPVFELGRWLPLILLGCMALLAVLLGLIQMIKRLF